MNMKRDIDFYLLRRYETDAFDIFTKMTFDGHRDYIVRHMNMSLDKLISIKKKRIQPWSILSYFSSHIGWKILPYIQVLFDSNERKFIDMVIQFKGQIPLLTCYKIKGSKARHWFTSTPVSYLRSNSVNSPID